MLGMRLHQAQAAFFDRAVVLQAASVAERRVLSRFGAFVRQRARTSIRPGRSSAPPGSPPRSHTGLLRRGIVFAFDRAARSVVIGPVQLNQRNRGVPPLLEYGGEAVRVRWGRARRVFYAPRPFMAPAFAAELSRLPPLWRDSIR